MVNRLCVNRSMSVPWVIAGKRTLLRENVLPSDGREIKIQFTPQKDTRERWRTRFPVLVTLKPHRGSEQVKRYYRPTEAHSIKSYEEIRHLYILHRILKRWEKRNKNNIAFIIKVVIQYHTTHLRNLISGKPHPLG